MLQIGYVHHGKYSAIDKLHVDYFVSPCFSYTVVLLIYVGSYDIGNVLSQNIVLLLSFNYADACKLKLCGSQILFYFSFSLCFLIGHVIIEK